MPAETSAISPAARNYRRRRGLATFLTLIVMTVAFIPVPYVCNKADPRRAAGKPDDILYLPRGKTLKYMTVGYNGVAADVTWIRGVLYVGRKLSRRDTNYQWLEKLYLVTTDLDPHWTKPYQAGAILLSALPQDDQRALNLLSKGMRNNGWNWNIPYGVAQLNLLRGKNREALKYLRLIRATMKDYAVVVPNIIAQLEKEGQDYVRATRTTSDSLRQTDDPVVRAILTSTYRETIARFLEVELTSANRYYSRVKGRPTGSVAQLLTLPATDRAPSVREGLVQNLALALSGDRELAKEVVAKLPADSFGMKFYVRPDGTVHSRGIERVELFRILKTVNHFMAQFKRRKDRPASNHQELVMYVRDLAAAGQLGEGARKFWGRPAKLPKHPSGRGEWMKMQIGPDDLLSMPEGPDVNKLFRATYPIPPGPRERERRARAVSKDK